jgi:hypothetical protein
MTLLDFKMLSGTSKSAKLDNQINLKAPKGATPVN